MPAHRERPQGTKALLKTQWFVDCTLVCKRGELKAHRAILCAHSGFFSRAFRSAVFEEAQTRTIKLDDDLTMVRAVVEFIYAGEYAVLKREYNTLSLKFHAEMYCCGDFFDVPDLKRYARGKFFDTALELVGEVDFFQLNDDVCSPKTIHVDDDSLPDASLDEQLFQHHWESTETFWSPMALAEFTQSLRDSEIPLPANSVSAAFLRAPGVNHFMDVVRFIYENTSSTGRPLRHAAIMVIFNSTIQDHLLEPMWGNLMSRVPDFGSDLFIAVERRRQDLLRQAQNVTRFLCTDCGYQMQTLPVMAAYGLGLPILAGQNCHRCAAGQMRIVGTGFDDIADDDHGDEYAGGEDETSA